jgi:hypothetical protein
MRLPQKSVSREDESIEQKSLWTKELRGRDIAVNAIAPGPTATKLFMNDKTPEQIEHLAKPT